MIPEQTLKMYATRILSLPLTEDQHTKEGVQQATGQGLAYRSTRDSIGR